MNEDNQVIAYPILTYRSTLNAYLQGINVCSVSTNNSWQFWLPYENPFPRKELKE